MRNPKTLNRLNAALATLDISSSQAANLMGVSKKTVQKWRMFSPQYPDITEKHLVVLESIADAKKQQEKA